MSQAGLAEPDLSDSYISLIESGRRIPSPAVVELLAERLGCSAAYLRCGVEETMLAELKGRLSDAHRALYGGRAEQALAQLTDLATSAELSTIPTLHAKMRHSTAVALEAAGRYDEAIAMLHQLLDPVSPAAAHPHGARGEADTDTGEGDVPVLGASRPGELGWPQWAALQVAVARCHRRSGHDDRAARTAGPAFTLAAAAADGGDGEAAAAAVELGAVLVEVFADRGDLLLARQTCTRLLILAQDSGHPRARLQAYRQAVLLAEMTGEEEDAAGWARRAVHLMEADETFRHATELHARCAALLLRVHPDQAAHARELLTRQLARAALTGVTPQTLTELAEAELLLDHPAQAAAHARQALHTPDTGGCDIAGSGAVPDWVTARALAALATASVQTGNPGEAITALLRRAELLERHGPSRQAAQAWLQAADLLAPPDSDRPDGGDEESRRVQFYQRALAAMGLQLPTRQHV